MSRFVDAAQDLTVKPAVDECGGVSDADDDTPHFSDSGGEDTHDVDSGAPMAGVGAGTGAIRVDAVAGVPRRQDNTRWRTVWPRASAACPPHRAVPPDQPGQP